MTEYEFMNKLKDRLNGHLQRIENVTEPGLPDFNWCVEGREIWLETKIRRTGVVQIRKEQYGWGLKRARNGGKVFLIAADEKVFGNKPELYVWRFPSVFIQTNPKYEHPIVQPTGMVTMRGFDSLQDFLLRFTAR